MAVAKLKIDAADALLSNADAVDGLATWAQEARKDAANRLRAQGAPIRRDEYWKYTNPADLTALPAPAAALFDAGEKPAFADVDQLSLVYVDGVLDPTQSDALAMDGLEIETLANAMASDIHWAKELFGVLEERGQKPVDRPMAALNTAVATQGLVIRVIKPTSKPIGIRYMHSSEVSDAHVHHVIKIEQGAKLTLLEGGPGAARFNSVLEVDVADTAEFHHIRTQGRDHERRTMTHMFGRLGRESIYNSFTFTANGMLTRNESVLELIGDDALATVAGAALGDGDNFHYDTTIFVTHDAVNCESRQVFKHVLRNGATGVFQGKILVKAGAQKTDGYQISQALLLDGDSTFLAKPELEIYADDVACSHGSTVGAIDEDAMFYLASRGVPKNQAQDMLVMAFLTEALDEIHNADLKEDVVARVSGWIERHS